MKQLLTLLFISSLLHSTMSQTPNPKDYYYEIPDYPSVYTASNAIARMVDGLGFRYYWATESLRDEDLAYKPSEEARSCAETLNHLYGMSWWVLSSIDPEQKRLENTDMSFAEKRAATLKNYELASKTLKVMSDEALADVKIALRGQDYPIWNHINGPIADALWHVGQIVSFRRASGNPFTSKVSVFTGALRE